MKRIMTLILAALPLAGACARERIVGSGVAMTETRNVGEFDQIELRIAADLKITIGEPSPLTIETDDNILPWIETEVRDGKLVISSDKRFKTKNGPDISVTVADLKALAVSGSGDLILTGLNNTAFKVALAGSGDVRLDGTTEELDIKISGSGEVMAKGLDNRSTKVALAGSGGVHLYGQTEELDIKISGSADVFASSLQAEEAEVSITGSGDVRIHVTEKLDVKITGSGDVVYRGSPKVKAKVTGSGNVTKSSDSA